MEARLTPEDLNQISKSILEKYAKVSESPDGLFKYPTGKSGLKGLNYDSDIIRSLPESVIDSYCGVGNPFSLRPINKGESVHSSFTSQVWARDFEFLTENQSFRSSTT